MRDDEGPGLGSVHIAVLQNIPYIKSLQVIPGQFQRSPGHFEAFGTCLESIASRGTDGDSM